MSAAPPRPALRARWLGRVAYADALALQTALWGTATTSTCCSASTRPCTRWAYEPIRPTSWPTTSTARGAEVHRVNRGGDVTCHGPGQLVGYPLVTAPARRGGGMADTVAYVHSVEQLLIDALDDARLAAPGAAIGCPGVWMGDEVSGLRKVAAIGVRLRRGRAMHGFALNVDPDLSWFDAIVPCGIADADVTSLASEGSAATMSEVVDAITDRAAALWGHGELDRADVVWRHRPGDLARVHPRRRAEPTEPSPTPERPAPVAEGSLRLHGRLAQAGVPRRFRCGPANPIGCAAPSPVRPVPAPSARPSAISIWSPCARRPGVPTNPSAGPTVRRPS